MKTLKMLGAALAAVTMTFTAQAAKTAKAVVADGGKTLEFVYDETNYGTKDTDRFSVAEAEAIDPPGYPPWYGLGNDVTEVIFDDSFAGYRPKHCSRWFYGFRRLSIIQNIGNLNTSEAKSFVYMFASCWALKPLDTSGFDTAKVTDMGYMFSSCSSLEMLDLSGFDTANVTNMYGMFEGCYLLTSLDLSGCDLAKVTNMQEMFSDCSSLRSLNLPDLVTANVTDMDFMFQGCSSLTSLAFSGFDTANVATMRSMFANCPSLKSLNLSGFDTAKVTDMGYMFANCSSLTTLDVSGFDTANVTTMYGMFDGCSSLTALDLSCFDTSKVENMEYMFRGCSSLQTIAVSDAFVTTAVRSSDDMFLDCKTLVGGVGTKYYSAKTDKTYARIDGVLSAPGYFTRGAGVYKIRFAANGGAGTMADQTCVKGKTHNLRKCTFTAPSGKTFAGWKSSKNGRLYADRLLVFDLAAPGEIVTMTAVWK